MTDQRDAGSGVGIAALVGTWALDPSATTVHLQTKAMWGMVTVKGSLRALEGGGVVRDDGSVSGTFVVDAASIDTAQGKRDKHLRGPDFFDVERYPTFTYAITSVALEPDGTASALGTFTARDQAHPLSVTGVVTATDATALTVTVTADLDRSQWGMDWTKMGARTDNHLTVIAVFRRP